MERPPSSQKLSTEELPEWMGAVRKPAPKKKPKPKKEAVSKATEPKSKFSRREIQELLLRPELEEALYSIHVSSERIAKIIGAELSEEESNFVGDLLLSFEFWVEKLTKLGYRLPVEATKWLQKLNIEEDAITYFFSHLIKKSPCAMEYLSFSEKIQELRKIWISLDKLKNGFGMFEKSTQTQSLLISEFEKNLEQLTIFDNLSLQTVLLERRRITAREQLSVFLPLPKLVNFIHGTYNDFVQAYKRQLSQFSQEELFFLINGFYIFNAQTPFLDLLSFIEERLILIENYVQDGDLIYIEPNGNDSELNKHDLYLIHKENGVLFVSKFLNTPSEDDEDGYNSGSFWFTSEMLAFLQRNKPPKPGDDFIMMADGFILETNEGTIYYSWARKKEENAEQVSLDENWKVWATRTDLKDQAQNKL